MRGVCANPDGNWAARAVAGSALQSKTIHDARIQLHGFLTDALDCATLCLSFGLAVQ